MNLPGTVPVRESVGAALRFARENWRFVLAVAAIGAAAQGLIFLLTGPGLLWLIALIAVSIGVHAALISAALNGAEAVRARLARDAVRVGGAMAIVGFFVGMIALTIIYTAMSVLIAPHADAVKAAEGDNERLQTIMNEAVAAQPDVMIWALIAGAALTFIVTCGFFAAAPASVDRGRVVVFESWRLAKGNLLRIGAARIMLLAPALVLAGAVQSLFGAGLGFGGGDPLATAAAAGANPYGFAVFYAFALFVQIVLYSSLEAGLASALYRRLRPPAP